MRVTDIEILFNHLYWVRDRLLEAAARLPPERFVSPDTVATRDLRATLVHELDVESSWRRRLRGAPAETWGPDAELRPADFPTVGTLAERWRRDEAEMRAWLAGLSDEALSAVWSDAGEPGFPLWFYLVHVQTHALQQFSDAATLLARAGQSPGELDFLWYADTRARRRR